MCELEDSSSHEMGEETPCCRVSDLNLYFDSQNVRLSVVVVVVEYYCFLIVIIVVEGPFISLLGRFFSFLGEYHFFQESLLFYIFSQR